MRGRASKTRRRNENKLLKDRERQTGPSQGLGQRLAMTLKQVHVTMGPLVATARGSIRHNLPTTDLLGATHGASQLVKRLSAVSTANLQAQDNTVNANSSSATVLGLQPQLNSSSTHQLIKNLLLQADNSQSLRPDYNDIATTTTTTTIDHNHLRNKNLTQYGQLVQTSGGRGPFTSYEWLMISTLVTIILISIVGNLLVCVAIFTDRRLRKLGNAFIVSLAIADLFVSFLVMTFALHNDLMEEWIFGAWFCDIWISFDIMCCTASILNLCAISLDRFIHIKDCLLYNQLMTRRVAISAVIMIWIISGLVSFVPITLGWHKPSSAISATSPNLPAHYNQASDSIARTTRQLGLNFTGGGAHDHREREAAGGGGGGGGGPERTRRAANYAIKHPEIEHKLNYPGASGDATSGRRWRHRANEPIGSANTSTMRRRWWRRLNTTQVAAGGGGGGDDDDYQSRPLLERLQETLDDNILMRMNEMRRFDKPASRVAARLAQAAASVHEKEERKKSNLGEGKPRPPMEQIKHLPRARRRRQVALGTLKLASSDYEEDEPTEDGAHREQTNQRAHSQQQQQQPSESNGTAPQMDSGRERANEPPQAAAPAPAPAQCMLTLTPTYAVISSTISFYIPCIIMLGLYSKLFACARRHVRNIKAISKVPQPIGAGGHTNSTHNYNGACVAASAASANNNNKNRISTSTSTSSGASNPTSRGGRAPAGSRLTPMVNCARRLIGAGNQRKPSLENCVINTTTCRLDTANRQSAPPDGRLARLFGSRARTWIKLRRGEVATQNSSARCKTSDQSGRAARNNQQRGSVTATSAGINPLPPVERLVLKSILSSQKQCHEQPPSATSQSRQPHDATEDNNNTLTHSSASANAELEPFLANARGGGDGGERKSMASTCALSVKLNMIGADANARADATPLPSSQAHQNQQQLQLYSRLKQHQQQLAPLQPTKQQTSQLATHKAAITLGIIMGTFLLCWLPFFCLNIIKAFYAHLIPAWLFRSFTWLGYANSALNPIIYGIHNSEFRNAFNRIFFKHLTLKNGRQYLNRRFSYDLRPHHNNSAAAAIAQARRRANHSQHPETNNNNNNNNNNSMQSESASLAPLALDGGANKTTSCETPNQLVGLARGESHALNDNNKAKRAQQATSNKLHGGATTFVKSNPRAHGQGRASSLAMGSSLYPHQQCLNLLNCMQDRGEGHTSASNTTVHRTSEDLSGVKVATGQVAPTAEEIPLQQIEPLTVSPISYPLL